LATLSTKSPLSYSPSCPSPTCGSSEKILNFWFLKISHSVVAVVKRKKDDILGALWNLSTMFYIVASVLIVSCLSPSNVISRKARFIMYFFGFGFSKLVGHLQVSHVTQTRFNQFIYSIILPITALNANTIIGYFRG